MRPPIAAVETPHRFKAAGLDTADSASTRGDLDEVSRRGVSGEGKPRTDAVKTPQRTRDTVRASSGPPLTDRHPDHAMQRGVSTEAPDLFKGRFRVQSTRLPGWDYRSNGYYFVTICTRNRTPFLGDIIDGGVLLSKAGEIVTAEWKGIALRRRAVLLDEWVVMPNHLHGIVVIHRDRGVETPQREQVPDLNSNHQPLMERHLDRGMQRGVSTESRLVAGSLGAIIGQFKSRATKQVWRAGFRDFGWQPGFYDHIIRDDRSLDDIRQYIMDNPAMWDSQMAIPENLWM